MEVTVQERLAVWVGVSVDDFVPVRVAEREREAVLETVGEMDDLVVTEEEVVFVPDRELVTVGVPLIEEVTEEVCLDEAEPLLVLVVDAVAVFDELLVLEGEVVDVAVLEAELVAVIAAEADMLPDLVED